MTQVFLHFLIRHLCLYRAVASFSRTARGTDYGSLTNSGQGQQDKVTGRKDVSMVIACDVRYQLSVLEVYASFVSTSGLNKQYLMKHEAKFRLTDLLLSQIRVTDPTVIALKGNVVEGLKPGLSEIQVALTLMVLS